MPWCPLSTLTFLWNHAPFSPRARSLTQSWSHQSPVALPVVGKEVLHLELRDALDPATREADEVGIRGVGEGLEVADVAATVTEGAISVALLPPLPNCTSSTPSHAG